MGIREEVEDGPRPWSINTAEQDVAVNSRLKPVRFDHAELKGLDVWLCGPRTPAQSTRQPFDIRARKGDIAPVGVQKTIEIDEGC